MCPGLGGVAARNAYSSGFELAMVIGAVIVAAVAMTAYLSLPAAEKVSGPQTRRWHPASPVRPGGRT